MNKIKFISLAAGIALAMAFTFSCSSGDDNNGGGGSSSSGGGDGGGSDAEKTLAVAIHSDIFNNDLSEIEAIVVPVGTAPNQVMDWVAFGEVHSIANPTNIPLCEVSVDGDGDIIRCSRAPRWTGSGTYDVFVALNYGGEHEADDALHKVGSVNFLSATTSIQVSNATKINGGGGGSSSSVGGSSSSGGGQGGVVYGETVNYEGGPYPTVVIGSQTWFAKNLNYNASGSKCYENEPDNCETYGRLYNWVTAKTACPGGWHLPSDDEWGVLVSYAGGYETAGGKLKARSGWNENGNGTDDFGFSALPGGFGYSNGSFNNDGENGYWWSATEGVPIGDISTAYLRYMHYALSFVDRLGTGNKTNLYSVRCVKD